MKIPFVAILIAALSGSCAQRYQTRPPSVAIVDDNRENHSFEVQLKVDKSDLGSFYHAILEGTEFGDLTRRQFHISVLRVERVGPEMMKQVRAKLDQIIAKQDQQFSCILEQVVQLSARSLSSSGIGVRCAREDEGPIRNLNSSLVDSFSGEFPGLMNQIPVAFQPSHFNPALEVAASGTLRLMGFGDEEDADRRQKAIAEINDRLKLTSNRRWPFTLTLAVY